MRATESVKITNIAAASDQAVFQLTGGVYVVDVVGSWGGGSATLERLGPDGTTWLPARAAFTADTVADPLAMPPGQYRVTVATATGVYLGINRVPGE